MSRPTKGHDPERASYRLPSATCATCGNPTSATRKGEAGFGDWHWNCRRINGRLVVRDKDGRVRVLGA